MSNNLLEQLKEESQEIAERHGLTEPIAEAFKLGAEREPNSYDIFVHPTDAFDYYDPEGIDKSEGAQNNLLQWQLEYFKKIIEKLLSNPENSIVINDKDSSTKKMMALHDRVVYSYQSRVTGGPTGYLDENGTRAFLQYTRGINPDDSYLVHGGQWTRCTTQFVNQLHCLKNFGGFMAHNGGERPGRNNSPTFSVTDYFLEKVHALLLELGPDEVSDIRFGVLHNSTMISDPAHDPVSNLFVGAGTDIIPSPGQYLANLKWKSQEPCANSLLVV